MKFRNLISSIKTKFMSFYGKNKKITMFVLIVVFLVIFCLFMFPNEKGKSESSTQIESKSMLTSNGYKEELENKLKRMLLSIDEIETADVMVVCDESEKFVYLKNITETTSGSGDSASKSIIEEVVYEKSGSNSAPIIVSKIMPKVVGVWIVINSVSPSTKLDIINSVSSVLNMDKSCISILQGR